MRPDEIAADMELVDAFVPSAGSPARAKEILTAYLNDRIDTLRRKNDNRGLNEVATAQLRGRIAEGRRLLLVLAGSRIPKSEESDD